MNFLGGFLIVVLSAGVAFATAQIAIVLERRRAKTDALATAEAEFSVEHVGGKRWLVTNVGTAVATHIGWATTQGAEVGLRAIDIDVAPRRAVMVEVDVKQWPASLLIAWTSHRGEERGPVKCELKRDRPDDDTDVPFKIW